MRRSKRVLAHSLPRHCAAWGLLLALGGAAWAQQAPSASIGGTTPYVDREIEGLTPEPVDDGPGPEYDRSGWPRFLRLETRLASSPFDANGNARWGFGGYGLLETPNHGALSFDGQYSPDSSGGTLTLRQRGLPMGAGWLGNHELGVITAPSLPVTRLASRIFVPSGYLRGLSGEWENNERGLLLQAGTGEPGRLAILPDTQFTTLGGRRDTLALQWRPGAEGGIAARTGWTLGVQHESASRVRDISLGVAAAAFDATATRLTLRHEDAGLRWQTQWLSSQREGQSARAAGWIDVEWDRGAWANGAGAYRLDEALTWAGQPMASDLEGVYLRSRYTQRRWSADGSIDLLRPVSGRTPGGYFATGNVRWRLSADSSLGAGLALRQLGERDWSSHVEWSGINGWGPTGVRLELEGGERRADVLRLLQDQDWGTIDALSLSTSVGLAQYGRDPFTGAGNGTQFTAAVNFNLPVGNRAGVRGGLISEHGPGAQRRDSLNLGANWRINHRWSLEGSWIWASGRARQAFTLDPLAPPVTVDSALSNRAFFVALRYELQAGSRDLPLGGRAADGGGRIEGVVFFDENRNGRQEANESGVPNATVYLDNRYALRTDSQGRFVFPFVGTGTRAVSLRGDSLPLPWNVVGDGNATADVPLRGTVRLNLPVQRAE